MYRAPHRPKSPMARARAPEPQGPKHQPSTRTCMQMQPEMQPAREATPLVECCVNRHDGDIRSEAGGKDSTCTREGTTPNKSDTCKMNEKKNEKR